MAFPPAFPTGSLPPAIGLAAFALLPSPAGSQALVDTGNATIRESLCVGQLCQDDPSADFPDPAAATLMLRNARTRIDFVDTSSSPGTYPSNDWSLIANDYYEMGENYFSIRDLSADVTPFRISAGAPPSAFYMASNGDIGLGTALPQADLEIVSSYAPEIRLQQSGGTGYPRTWSISGDEVSFQIGDVTKGTYPFVIDATAPHGSGYFTSDGLMLNVLQDENFNFNVKSANDPFAFFVKGETDHVGIGTNSPDTMLHLKRDGGDTQLKIEETSGTQTARPLLNMVNHGRPDIIMANTATGGEWAFGAGTNFVLKNGAVGSSDGDKNLQLKLYGATGNLEIAGQLITGGPTCASGCDAVFSESYDLPSIQEHAEAMFSLGHLPNVGPTAPNQPVNMSEQYGKLLNELEHAHIYIAKLEEQLRDQKAESADLKSGHAALEARLDALVARLPPRP